MFLNKLLKLYYAISNKTLYNTLGPILKYFK